MWVKSTLSTTDFNYHTQIPKASGLVDPRYNETGLRGIFFPVGANDFLISLVTGKNKARAT